MLSLGILVVAGIGFASAQAGAPPFSTEISHLQHAQDFKGVPLYISVPDGHPRGITSRAVDLLSKRQKTKICNRTN